MNDRRVENEAATLDTFSQTHGPSHVEPAMEQEQPGAASVAAASAAFPSPPDMDEHDSLTADDLLDEIGQFTRQERSDTIDESPSSPAMTSAARSAGIADDALESDAPSRARASSIDDGDLADFDPSSIRYPSATMTAAPAAVPEKPGLFSRFRAAVSSAIGSVARVVGKVIDRVSSSPEQQYGSQGIDAAAVEPERSANDTVDPISDELRAEAHEAAHERTEQERTSRSLTRSRSQSLGL